MNRFQRSWQLAKTSFAVMRRDKQLLLFPILTTSFTALVTLLFLVPVAFQPTGHGYTSAAHWTAVGNSIYATQGAEKSDGSATTSYRVNRQYSVQNVRPLAVAYFAVMYFTSMFLATFFNVAFYQQILCALEGQAVSIGGGLRFACTKWKSILMWTLFAGAIGYVIKALEQRFGLVGRLVMRLLGAAWSVACVFVIPVIITEERSANPLTVLKESALTLKKTWGESLIGFAGVSFGGTLVVLGSLLWLGGGIAISVSMHLYWLTALVVVAWILAMMLWSYLMGVASQIFRCALYVYATRGTLPAPYTDDMVALAWKMKKA